MEAYKFNFINQFAGCFILREFISNLDVVKFIACQFGLESNFGRSDLAVLHSNICGMKVPYRRYSVRIGFFGEFATYSNWFDCVKDYLLWVFFNRPYQNVFDSVDSYCLFLRDSGYCPEKDYIDKIKLIYLQFKTLENE